MPELTFTIGEVATLLGITPKAIKHYHKVGLLAEPARDHNHYRVYDMAQITRLQQILRLKTFGLSLKQIEIIVKANDPDALIPIVLNQHLNSLRGEIATLQQQLNMTEDFVNSGVPLSETITRDHPSVSSLTALSEAIKTHHNGISDILVDIERDVMFRLDQFEWGTHYEFFWHLVGKQLIKVISDEGLFIFWMERYLALASMEVDDLQGRSWLNELQHSPARGMLRRAFAPPTFDILPESEQQQILKVLPSLLYDDGSALQKRFLMLLIQR